MSIPQPTEADLALDAAAEYVCMVERRTGMCPTPNCAGVSPDIMRPGYAAWIRRAVAAEDLNRQLADRVAACSELLAARAERFEREAYLEGWEDRGCAGLTNPPDESWLTSDSAKRLGKEAT